MPNESLDQYAERQLQALREQGLYRRLRVVTGPQGPRAEVDGKQVINLSSNNYLGLANDERLKQASIRATEQLGVGSGAVRTIVGTMALHEELERKLAEFKGTEASLLIQSGFTANAAVLGSLLEQDDLVLSDELNHASIIDALRLSRATRRVYRHNDMQELERLLHEGQAEQHGKTLIVSDGVFSMDGDIAPLDQISALAERYGAITMVDDAHASGVLGEHGRGTVKHFQIAPERWDIQVGTLSKAIGAVGGYVACSRKLRELMEHRARPFLFSTSLPPGVTASCIAAVDLLLSDEGKALIERLWENTRMFKRGLAQLGFDTGLSQTPITPVIIGEGGRTHQFSDELFARGVFAQGIAYPTVARDKGRVRTIVSASHSSVDLEQALDAFEQAGRAMEVI